MLGHIHQALAQVRELQQKVLEKQYFKGYSGRARALSGTIAMLAACVMWLPWYPLTREAHVVGWGAVFVIGAVLNYGALIYWYFSDRGARRDFRRIKPAFDVFPALLVGGVLTHVFLREGLHDLLPGMWMALFGVANLASQRVLPRMINVVGWFYVTCGAISLLVAAPFTNPWPMAVVFFFGEWAGGFVLHFDRLPRTSLVELMCDFLFSDRRGGERL